MSGDDIEASEVHELATFIHKVEVFYRANPKHKLKIVKVRTLPKNFLVSSFYLGIPNQKVLCENK